MNPLFFSQKKYNLCPLFFLNLGIPPIFGQKKEVVIFVTFIFSVILKVVKDEEEKKLVTV